MSTGLHTIKFMDSGREPQVSFNRKRWWGIDVDGRTGFYGDAQKFCEIELPWPAPRCGVLRVECKTCGIKWGLTVAGRVDDPRTLKMACYSNRIGLDPVERPPHKV